MHTVSNSFRHQVSGELSTMFRGTESMLRFILCVLQGHFSKVWGPWVIRGLLSSARMHHGNSYICSHYNSANKHSCSRNIRAQCFRFDLTQKCLYIQYKKEKKITFHTTTEMKFFWIV